MSGIIDLRSQQRSTVPRMPSDSDDSTSRSPAFPPRVPAKPLPAKIPRPEEHAPRLTLNLPVQKQSTPLARLLCDSSLPECVRLGESPGVPVAKSKYGLDKGDFLLLHFVREHEVVHARDSGGKELRLPVIAQQKYEILPQDPKFDDTEYDGTAALIFADPLPEVVRVVEAHCSCLEGEDQTDGDIVFIDGVEEDDELGEVLVGTCDSAPIRFSTGMNTSRYTTMISPDSHDLSELIKRKFPLRVRVPDPLKLFFARELKKETVLMLEKVSTETCVVATKAGDSRIYSIPVNAPIAFETVETVGLMRKKIMELLPPLYPLVNATWGLIDPTQELVSAGMERIPCPHEEVMKAWIKSKEGKEGVAEAASVSLKDLQDEISRARNEMWQVRSELNDAQKKRPLPPTPSESFTPSRPPRIKEGNAKDEQPPPVLPPRRNGKEKDSKGPKSPNLNTYAVLPEIKLPTTGIGPQSMVEQMRNILVKKEMEITELKKKTTALEKKCTTLERENTMLKQKADYIGGVYEELPESHDLSDQDYLVPIPKHSLLAFTVDEVGQFLKEVGMAQYTGTFVSNGVDGELLAALGEEHFKELGMTGLHSVKLKLQVNKRLGRR